MKLSGRSVVAPLSDESRWGHQQYYVTRMRENTFRQKYDRYMKGDPLNADRKRKAISAVAAKMARVAHGLMKTGTDYRPFFEAAVPSGALRSPVPSRHLVTS